MAKFTARELNPPSHELSTVGAYNFGRGIFPLSLAAHFTIEKTNLPMPWPTGAYDAKTPLVKETIRAVRDVLMGVNRDHPDALGDFGFKGSDARSRNGGLRHLSLDLSASRRCCCISKTV